MFTEVSFGMLRGQLKCGFSVSRSVIFRLTFSFSFNFQPILQLFPRNLVGRALSHIINHTQHFLSSVVFAMHNSETVFCFLGSRSFR